MFHDYKRGQVTDDNYDLHLGQKSTVVKCDNLYYKATTFDRDVPLHVNI